MKKLLFLIFLITVFGKSYSQTDSIYLYAQPDTLHVYADSGTVGFYVRGYYKGEWFHVGGVTIYIDVDTAYNRIGKTDDIQSCTSNLGIDLDVDLPVGKHKFYARSGDGKNTWRDTFTIEKDRKIRIPLSVDFTKYKKYNLMMKYNNY